MAWAPSRNALPHCFWRRMKKCRTTAVFDIGDLDCPTAMNWTQKRSVWWDVSIPWGLGCWRPWSFYMACHSTSEPRWLGLNEVSYSFTPWQNMIKYDKIAAGFAQFFLGFHGRRRRPVASWMDFNLKRRLWEGSANSSTKKKHRCTVTSDCSVSSSSS